MTYGSKEFDVIYFQNKILGKNIRSYFSACIFENIPRSLAYKVIANCNCMIKGANKTVYMLFEETYQSGHLSWL